MDKPCTDTQFLSNRTYFPQLLQDGARPQHRTFGNKCGHVSITVFMRLLLACITILSVHRCGLLSQLSTVVCPSVTLVSPAKTAEPIEMPFGLRTWVGPRNHVLDRGPDPQWEGEILKGHPIVKYRDTLRSSVQKRLNRSWCGFDCGHGLGQRTMN